MTTKKETYYDILEVSPSASEQDIKMAYRRLVVLYHPDRIGNTEENRERFFAFQKAYETLHNPELRQAYDRWLVTGTSDKPDDIVRNTAEKVIESLQTFEAQILHNETKRMNQSDKELVQKAILYAKELFYDRNMVTRGHSTDQAARLLKEVVASRKDIMHNETVAAYLDLFADSMISKTPTPKYVSMRTAHLRKGLRLIIMTLVIIAVGLIAVKYIRNHGRNEGQIPEDSPREKVEIKVKEHVPYEEPDNFKDESINNENIGTKDINEDSLFLKDSGIYD